MEKTLDARGLKCPMPIVKARKELGTLAAGETLRVLSTDKGSVLDFQGWVKQNPGLLLTQSQETDDQGRDLYVHLLRRA